MQNVGGGDAAGEISIDVDVIGIDHFGDVGDRRDRDAAFVDAAIDGDVGVTIDDAGHDELSCGVDHFRALGSFDSWPDFGNFAVLDEYRAVLDGAVRDSEDGGVLNEHHRVGVRRRRWRCEQERCDGEQCDKRCRHRNIVTNFHRASPLFA